MSEREWKFVAYDVEISAASGPREATATAEAAVDALQQKGFCVLNAKSLIEALAEGGDLLKEADHEVRQLEESGVFQKPPAQILNGLLGEEGSGAICELEEVEEDEEQDSPNIRKLDRVLTAVTSILQPVSEPMLGLSFGGRSTPLLHLAGDTGDEEEEEEQAPKLSEAEADKWLSVFVNQRIMLLLFLGPGKGHLELQPFRHEDSPLYVLSTEPGTCVAVRTDSLTQRFYSYDRSVVLTGWLQQTTRDAERADAGADEELLPPTAVELIKWINDRMKVLKEKEVMGPAGAKYGQDEIPREWQCAMNHTYVKGVTCAVRGMAAKMPGTWSPYNTWNAMSYGADMAIEVPMMRWKVEDHYSPELESWKFYKTYTKHGIFIEGAELFDPKPFGLAVYEAKGMDPCQRHILETSYETLLDGGFSKKSLMRSLIGVYIGAATTEFQFAENCNEGVGTSCAGAITSNRISFCLGMQGPSFTCDAGGASSLGALSCAVNSIRFQTELYKANHSALAGAVNLILAPQFYVLGCAAGFLSSNGRSQSFDVAASGYVRGEGIAALVVTPFAELVDGVPVRDSSRPFHGNIPSISVSHCGQTASLTAPSGPQETALINEAVRQASLSPLDVDMVEVWGEAGILSDAVAVKAVENALRKDDESNTVLGLSSVQSGFGFMHESLGMAQLYKIIFSGKCSTQAPGIHLCELNPHIDAWEGEPLNFHTECVHYRHVSAFCGVASKSSSGTMGHAVAWGEMDYQRYTPRKQLKRDMIAFWPAGGGELPDGAEPTRNYWIVGSWDGSEWENAEPMKMESDGVYGYTVTLGVNLFQHFQIWLDGNNDRALHPGMAYGPKNVPVKGPDEATSCEGMAWVIDGRERTVELTPKLAARTDGGEGKLEAAEPLPPPGLPGDQYRVRLHVAGKWRTVDWTLVERGAGWEEVIHSGNYYVVGQWSGWDFTPMACDSPGVYHAEVKVRTFASDFLIVRNRDWQQSFFPAEDDCDKVEGPDLNPEFASWSLRAKPGDVVRIEFQRSWKDGVESRSISWKSLAT
uniref:Type I polyketide synthase n=1 Tax=Gambierdiscus polynesiensis TaxID=439318 RepID=A0A1S6K875_9DINO|nr:type I polyketide synthase [Gambierdiscus polynesiensis]